MRDPINVERTIRKQIGQAMQTENAALQSELSRYRAGVEIEGVICFDEDYKHWCFYPSDSNALKVDEDHKRVRVLVMTDQQEEQK